MRCLEGLKTISTWSVLQQSSLQDLLSKRYIPSSTVKISARISLLNPPKTFFGKLIQSLIRSLQGCFVIGDTVLFSYSSLGRTGLLASDLQSSSPRLVLLIPVHLIRRDCSDRYHTSSWSKSKSKSRISVMY